MPSGNVIVQTDRPDSPHLKTDRTVAYSASASDLIAEGPGFEAQVVYIRIKRSWNIGWLKIQYIKSGTQNLTVQLKDSQGNVLAFQLGSVQEGEFTSEDPVNLKTLPDPAFLVLEISGGADTFLYWAVYFQPRMNGQDVDPVVVVFNAEPRTGSWRDIGPESGTG